MKAKSQDKIFLYEAGNAISKGDSITPNSKESNYTYQNADTTSNLSRTPVSLKDGLFFN